MKVEIAVADGLHQMGLAQTDAAIDVERVVLHAHRGGDVFRGRDGELVGVAVDVVFKGEAGKEAGLFASPLDVLEGWSLGLSGSLHVACECADGLQGDLHLAAVEVHGHVLNGLQIRRADRLHLAGGRFKDHVAAFAVPPHQLNRFEPIGDDHRRKLHRFDLRETVLPEVVHDGPRCRLKACPGGLPGRAGQGRRIYYFSRFARG